MPLYLGHKNTKGLPVSPALQALKIDMLRAPPSAVNVIARPIVIQPGFASYVNHLSAFMKATNENQTIRLTLQGYPTNFAIDKCLPTELPPLVIDYGTTPPSKVIEDLGKIGFERLSVQKNENVLFFPIVTFDDIRSIKKTTPNTKTPCPAGSVNLDAFESFVLVSRVISSFLTTHVYPAFRDDGHFMEEVESLVDEIMTSKRDAEENIESAKTKQRKGNEGQAVPLGEEMVVDEEEGGATIDPQPIVLRRAKPTRSTEPAWGPPSRIPNASGLFFPFVPELASYDDSTVPRLIEDYLLQSLGSSPEQQMDRYQRIRSAWGIMSKTAVGDVFAHLCRIIRLAITSQARCFPIVQDKVYQGCVLSGGRFWVGLNGAIHKPLTYEKLQEEAGNYQLHSRCLREIASIASNGGGDNDEVYSSVMKCTGLRELKNILLDVGISESDKDEVKRLAMHLRFKNDSHLAANPQTIRRVLSSMTNSNNNDDEDVSLPLHYSALFSRDTVLTSLAAFGFQAPSFMIDNCASVALKEAKPPTTLVFRQKPLDVAVLDWKKMLDTKEIRNNPKNLSRANRDRTITGNDKTVIWASLKEMCGTIAPSGRKENESGFVVDTKDGLDDW